MRIPRFHTSRSRSRSRSTPRSHHAKAVSSSASSQAALLKKPTTTAAFKLVSRVVELTTPKKPTSNPVSAVTPRNSNIAVSNVKKAKKQVSRRYRTSARRCPKAPYNTTSYIIDLHRNSEDNSGDVSDVFPEGFESQDEFDELFDVNFFDTSVLGFVLRGDHDSYEINSVYEIAE